MKLLGKGKQYKVLDIGNGRGLKVAHSICYQCALGLYMWLQGKSSFIQSYIDIKRVIRMRRDSVAYLKHIRNFYRPAAADKSSLFGRDNLCAGQGSNIGERPPDLPFCESKKIVDQYIRLILTTWQYGFSDTGFPFAFNNGLNAQGELVQIDFGAIVFSPDLMETHIINKRWLKTDSYHQLKNKQLKEYYRLSMDVEVSLLNLRKLWGTSLKMNGKLAKSSKGAARALPE